MTLRFSWDPPMLAVPTMGVAQAPAPAPRVQCDQKNRKELFACLAPNRRVEVTVKGDSAK